MEWRDHPVTLAVNEAIQGRINDSKESIVNSTDPEYDRFLKGMIWAFREVLDAQPDFLITEDVKLEL